MSLLKPAAAFAVQNKESYQNKYIFYFLFFFYFKITKFKVTTFLLLLLLLLMGDPVNV